MLKTQCVIRALTSAPDHVATRRPKAGEQKMPCETKNIRRHDAPLRVAEKHTSGTGGRSEFEGASFT